MVSSIVSDWPNVLGKLMKFHLFLANYLFLFFSICFCLNCHSRSLPHSSPVEPFVPLQQPSFQMSDFHQ
jgi:hypothetical protein